MKQDRLRLVRQEKGSKHCGQACLAMITGMTIEQMVHESGRSQGTRTVDLVRVLRRRGYKVPDRLTVLPSPPKYAIGKQPHIGGRGWHWVVFWNGKRYDPIGTGSSSYGSPISSYLPIELPEAA